MFFLSLLLPTIFPIVAAQTKSIVCVAGQCLQGSADTNLGVTLSIPSNPPVLLLPGEYTSSTQPQLLSTALSYPQGLLSFPSGFSSSSSSTSTISLPLTVALQPGVLSYPQPLYRGQATFTSGQGQANIPISSGSFLVAPNTWAVISTSSNIRFIVWDSAPDISQLPLPNGGGVLTLTDIQPAGCSPPCASPGSCSPSGKCTCPSNFSGQSCENCASGFFGPSCQQCPSGCATCDEGITGSGRCFDSTTSSPSCNCPNGVCSANGCTCNLGWGASSNGTACAACALGFYMTSSGDCSACHSTCEECSDGTGACTLCKSGLGASFSQPEQCLLSNSNCTQPSTFSSGGGCPSCSAACQSCNGPNPTDCVVCDQGTFMTSQGCSFVSPDGTCIIGGGIADSASRSCTGCPAKCTACHYSKFDPSSSTSSQAQCTSCILGSILVGGRCISQCPSGTFLTPDGQNCASCDPSCSTCLGEANFCRTCSSGQFTSNGTCTATCPPNTFLSGSTCLPCHPDCATCSGMGFNQCLTCPSSRPALSSGQCLPVCSRSQFLDSISSCKSCDASCTSCSGAGPGACLACGTNQVLKAGTCVSSACTNGSVVPGLGACLSDLVTSSNSTLPSYTPPPSAPRSRGMPWWQILLMSLGSIFLVVLLAVGWRRYARKWARAKTHAWRHRFDKRFGLNPQPGIVDEEIEDRRLERVRRLEEAIQVKSPRGFDRAPSPVLLVSSGDRYRDSFSKPARSPTMMDSPRTKRSENLLRFSTTTGTSSYGTPETLQPMPLNAASRSQPAMYQRERQNLSIL